jgi:hypothetical protein
VRAALVVDPELRAGHGDGGQHLARDHDRGGHRPHALVHLAGPAQVGRPLHSICERVGAGEQHETERSFFVDLL